MSPKHFFFSPERHPGASNLDSRTGGEAITVIANRPSDPDSQEVFVGISMDYSSADKGEAWAAVDANEVRDAIDRAVGKREEAAAAKPYRPIDRDRLLRHIEDLEATLTRRNERHGRDQERIRELEAEVFTLREIKDSYEEPKTAREYLQLAWEAATVPEDGTIHEREAFIVKSPSDATPTIYEGHGCSYTARPHGDYERRLLDPRVEPAADEKRRAEYEAQGLEGWEIELLLSHDRG